MFNTPLNIRVIQTPQLAVYIGTGKRGYAPSYTRYVIEIQLYNTVSLMH